MLILKGVEVICFDTLLQVLILKQVTDARYLQERKSNGPDDIEGGRGTRVAGGHDRHVGAEFLTVLL